MAFSRWILCAIVALSVMVSALSAAAQACPSEREIRTLERRKDQLGLYCRAFLMEAGADRECAGARATRDYGDADACHYAAENLVSHLRDCVRRGGPYTAHCAALQGRAEARLAAAAADPLWRGTQERRGRRHADLARCRVECTRLDAASGRWETDFACVDRCADPEDDD